MKLTFTLLTTSVVAILAMFLCSCTATTKLSNPQTYLTATPALDAEHTAYLINDGFMQCIEYRSSNIQRIGDGRWLVTYDIVGSLYGDKLYAVEITNHEARIAPFMMTDGLRRNCGLIAEWIEEGRVTACRADDSHLSRWKEQHSGETHGQ